MSWGWTLCLGMSWGWVLGKSWMVWRPFSGRAKFKKIINENKIMNHSKKCLLFKKYLKNIRIFHLVILIGLFFSPKDNEVQTKG